MRCGFPYELNVVGCNHAVYQLNMMTMAEFKTITRDELKQWMDEGKDFVLLDVLADTSYEMKHLPGAVHADVNADDFLEKVVELVPDKSTPVVAYCGSFTCQRSPRAAAKLVETGYMDVYDYEGGLADWLEGGLPTEGAMAEAR